jgi:hypothetical protein
MFFRFVAAAIADSPLWISFVPAVTGFLGTIVGGWITYRTTTSANQQKEKVEREEQRIALVRDVSLRFIQAVQKQHLESLKLKLSTENVEAFQKISEQMGQGGDPAELIAAFLATPGNPRTQNPTTQLERLQSMIEGIKGASGLSETTALLAEMRLLLPNHIIDIAAIVAMLSLVEQATSALPHMNSFPPGYKNAIVDIFTNAVRKEMGLNEYMPDAISYLNLFAKLKKASKVWEPGYTPDEIRNLTPDEIGNLIAKLEKLDGDAEYTPDEIRSLIANLEKLDSDAD